MTHCTVKNNNYGRCFIAIDDIAEGVIIEKFDGTRLKYHANKPVPDEVSEQDINYFFIVDNEYLIIPRTNARYINHSCDPNCDVNDDLEVVTIKPVKKGDEVTISYNVIDKKWVDALWDSRWNFKCQCGSPNCQGVINKYVYQEGDKWIQVGNIYNDVHSKENKK